MKLAAADPRHGTANGYMNHGCRCADCTEAASAYVARGREASRAQGFANLTHGKIGTYISGCRCDECREAKRLYAQTNDKQRATSIAQSRASAWMRENAPGAWRVLVGEALTEIRDGAA